MKQKQSEIAKFLNISDSYLSMILNGKRNINWQLANLLCEKVGYNPEFWMTAKPSLIKHLLFEGK